MSEPVLSQFAGPDQAPFWPNPDPDMAPFWPKSGPDSVNPRERSCIVEFFTRLAASSIEYGKVTSCYVDSIFPQPILLCIWSLLYSATTQRTNTQIFALLFRKDIISFQSKFSARIETVNLVCY